MAPKQKDPNRIHIVGWAVIVRCNMRAEDEKTLASLVLALGVIIALFFPEISHLAAPYLLHALFFVMVFSLLPFARHAADQLTKIHPVVMSLVFWQQGVVPAAVVFLSYLINLDHQTSHFVLIMATSGSLFASPTLVQLMGLEQRVAVQTVIVSTLAAPISVYFGFNALPQSDVNLDMYHFALRLFVFLVIPIVIFLAVRSIIANWDEQRKNTLDRFGRWGSVLALVVFCFALEDRVTYAIADDPVKVIEYLLLAIAVAAGIGFTTRIVMSRYGKSAAATATLLASFRNVGLTFGLIGISGSDELAIYVGVCQIPMFFAPLMFDLFVGKSRFPYRSAHEQDSAVVNDPTMDQPTVSNSGISGDGPAPRNSINPPSGSVPNAKASSTMPAFHGNAAVAYLPESSNPQPEADTLIDGSIELLNENSVAEPNPNLLDAKALQEQLLKRQSEISRVSVATVAEVITQKMKAVSYVWAFVLLVAAGMVAIWHANKMFFPMLFDQQLIERVADAHTAGNNFGVFDLNINIRDLRNATIARMSKTPEVVVLGASHWQEAHIDLMPGRDFYNSHVHRDYYEDMMAVTEMWVRNGKLPKELIITIRDNLLTPVAERTDFLWLPGIKYYRDFARRIGFEPHSQWETLPTNTWRELLSLPLLWGQAKRQLTTLEQPHETNGEDFEHLDVLLPGGSILWSREHKRIFTQERAREEALAFAKARRNDPPKIDPLGIEHMERLFDYLVENGVKVTLAHPQFNPIYWDAVQDSPYMDGLEKIEKLTQSWADAYGFEVIGGFAPESVGCTADMYIDAEHGNPKCLGMLLAQYGPANSKADFKFDLRGTLN